MKLKYLLDFDGFGLEADDEAPEGISVGVDDESFFSTTWRCLSTYFTIFS